MSESPLRAPRGNDADFIKLAQTGSAEAWGALVDRYSGYVYSLLKTFRVPESDQSDAFQHVFIELFKALPQLKKVDLLTPWLRQTTLRHAVRVRKKLASGEVSLEDVEYFVSDQDLATELEQTETAQIIRDAVQTQSPKCQELIMRLFFDESPQRYADVAQAMGLKPASIVMTRQRCLEALEKSLRARGIG
ncbi:RpoE DNA-directed RNA polymerase specialized sigma subunit, sigma24 homolog [Fimbriimonadaceae bacterium]